MPGDARRPGGMLARSDTFRPPLLFSLSFNKSNNEINICVIVFSVY